MARVKVFDKNKNEWVYADKALGSVPIKGVDYFTEADKAAIVQEVIDAIGLNIIGEVDSANNILITMPLPDGTYTMRYENADGSTMDIGTFSVNTNTGSVYTNLADPTSSDWMTNKRINSSNNVVDVTEAQRDDKTCIVTNFISLEGLSKLHIKGLDILNDLPSGQNYGRMYIYKGDTIFSSTYQPSVGLTTIGKTHYTVADYDSSVVILDVATAIKDWGYTGITHVRLGGFLTGAAEDVIITADQNIV